MRQDANVGFNADRHACFSFIFSEYTFLIFSGGLRYEKTASSSTCSTRAVIMTGTPGDQLSDLPKYLRDILNELPGDHRVAFNSPNGLPIEDIRNVTDRRKRFAYLLLARHFLTQRLGECPGPCPELILKRAEVYEVLGYSDLALADAYVSYTLCLVVLDDPDISDLAPVDSNGEPWPAPEDGKDDGEGSGEDGSEGNLIALRHKFRSLFLMCRSALVLGAHAQAQTYLNELLAANKAVLRGEGHDAPADKVADYGWITDEFMDYFTVYEEKSKFHTCVQIIRQGNPQLTRFGWCQRQIYPWNEHEPDRMSKEALKEINEKLHEVAPDLEVEISTLPTLSTSRERGKEMNSVGEDKSRATTNAKSSSQLGLFAKKQLDPGTTILTERSLLTGIKPHGEALCDACAADMEGISREDRRYCPACDLPFCSEECLSAAMEHYHRPNEDNYETDEGYPPAEAPFCPGAGGNDDIHNLGRAESSTTPEWDLYFLLLSRTMQMSETQKMHPLNLFHVKYLWGDFSPAPGIADFPVKSGPKTLPYSIRHHVELPLQWFEILMHSNERCRPYSATWLKKYDWWIIQTLFAKFRGVADATQSTWTGKPEVATVHPLWCLANHSCNPNVFWNPLGTRKLSVVKERVWARPDKPALPAWPGIRAGEEIWSHYTDVSEKSCPERRARLHAVLGGDCCCERCKFESASRATVVVPMAITRRS